MKTYKVIATDGLNTELFSDDSFTLALPEMIESTPRMLSELISRESLEEISRSEDLNDREKALRALALLDK